MPAPKCHLNDVVLPGEVVESDIVTKASIKSKTILGPGLKRKGDDVVVCKSGVLKLKAPATLWVDSLQKRYIPIKEDSVVGIITKKAGDYFKVDINAADQALLHYQSFEGATKKNRTVLNVGDAVFGRLVVSSPDMEPELICMSAAGKKESFGKLHNDGFIFRTSIHLIRKILHPSYPLLKYLANKFSYEAAFGHNGVIWIRGASVEHIIYVANAILDAETMSVADIKRTYSGSDE